MHTRLRFRWEVLLDVVACVTAIAALADAIPSGNLAGIAFILVAAALVAARRRYPIATAAGAVVISGLVFLVPDAALAVWVLAEVCLFSVPLRSSRVSAIGFGLTHAAVLYLYALIVFDVPPLDQRALILPVWTGGVVAFGAALRAQIDYVKSADVSARSAAAAREEQMLTRINQERMSIARDLHDSVANSIAVISINSALAERHVRGDPARAQAALHQIRLSSRAVLTEVEEILTVLRNPDPGDDGDTDVDHTPASAANLPALVTAMRSAGLDVVESLAELPPLDPAVDAALFRVAQEALTNANRHGSGVVHVTTTVSGSRVRLSVTNPAASASETPSPVGFGLVGMHERVALAGGTLTVDSTGDRFGVVADMPVRPAPEGGSE